MEKQLSRKNCGEIVLKCVSAACIVLLAFVFSFQCSINLWETRVPGIDSSVFQYVARVMLDGGMPYVDTFDHKGPLIYLINVAGLLISKWRGIWLIELMVLIVTFALIYRIARLKCSYGVSLLVLLCVTPNLFSYYEGGNFTEVYAMPCIAAAVYIFADYFLHNKINCFRLLVCGFTFGAVFLLRINMAVVWAVMCIAVLAQCLSLNQYKRLGYFLIYFILGFLLIASPILVWLAVNGAFPAFIKDYFVFNFAYSSHPGTANYASRFSSVLYFLNNEFIIVALGASIYFALKKRDLFHCFYVAFIIGSLLVNGMAGRSYPHYGMILIPAIAYPYACLITELATEFKAQKGTALLITLMLLSNCVFSVWGPAMSHALQASYTPTEQYLEHNATKVRNMVRYCTDEDDRIIVIGNWDAVYNLSDRFAASKYSYQTVGDVSPEIKEEFFAEIQQTMPKAIVLQKGCFEYYRMVDFIEENDYQWIWQTDDQRVDFYLRNDEKVNDKD